MKGKIIDIATFEDEYHNITYRITVEFSEIPKHKLGKCEVKQID